MADIDPPATENPQRGAEALEQLAGSARGWHRIQLAVLGFIGFCGVFWDGAGSETPAGVRWTAAALVATAFVLANLAIFMVGRVAHPFHDPTDPARAASDTEIDSRAYRLRTGVRLTYLALALLVAATLSSWLPTSPEGDAAAAPDNGAVHLENAAGVTWCGQVVEARHGEILLHAADDVIPIPFDGAMLVSPRGGC